MVLLDIVFLLDKPCSKTTDGRGQDGYHLQIVTRISTKNVYIYSRT